MHTSPDFSSGRKKGGVGTAICIFIHINIYTGILNEVKGMEFSWVFNNT